jgi:hypothetical protein
VTDFRKKKTRRGELLTLRVFASEMAELIVLAERESRTPGDQVRALIHAAIRQAKNDPSWIPSELRAPERRERE